MTSATPRAHILAVLLLSVLGVMPCAAAEEASAPVPLPERAADCIAKSGNAIECFVEQASFRFLYCKVTVQAAAAGIAKDVATACSHNGKYALTDFYGAALKRLAKNKAAQSMVKDYYAFWRSAMSALVPSGETSRLVWGAQAAQLEAELDRRGERLQLEQ